MKKLCKRIAAAFLALALGLAGSCLVSPVTAEAKTATITNKDYEGDLTVMFVFDTEVVDITFIAPSGSRYTKDSDGVQYASGDGWATYRISDAEQGSWSVEYELGSNSSIDYSIILDDNGITVDSFEVTDSQDGQATVSFEADYDYGDVYYSYELYLIGADGASSTLLRSGSAKANEITSVDVDFGNLASGSYSYDLEVWYDDGEIEVFDSYQSDYVDLVNSDGYSSIEDYLVYIDLSNGTVTVDWSDYTEWSYEGYRIVITADDEVVAENEWSSDVKNQSTGIASDTKKLQVSLAYEDNDTWSEALVKTIDLTKEYITTDIEDVTGSVSMQIQYKTAKERVLTLTVGEETGEYSLDGEDYLSVGLEQGANTLYAVAEMDDGIFFVIDKEIYVDSNPPAILLYENLDGMTFTDGEVDLLGQVTGASSLTVNGKDVTIEEDGSFDYKVSLAIGGNVILLVATDVNGNESTMAITLYRSLGGVLASTDSSAGWTQYIPFFAAVVVSIVVIVLAILFLKKKDKNLQEPKETGSKHMAAFLVAEIILGLGFAGSLAEYIIHYRYSISLKFLDLVEESASAAVEYLKVKKAYGIASIVCLVLFILLLVFHVVIRPRLGSRKKDGGSRKDRGGKRREKNAKSNVVSVNQNLYN